MILTTRPSLLHALVQSKEKGWENSSLSREVLTLVEACVHAARHSHSLIVGEWIKSSLHMFGPSCAQCLFSSALVLVMSRYVSGHNVDEHGALDTAREVLASMSSNGNLAAAEFRRNLEQVKISFEISHSPTRGHPAPPSGHAVSFEMPLVSGDSIATRGGVGYPANAAIPLDGITMEMAFMDPMMQEFLAQSHLEAGLIEDGDLSATNPRNLFSEPTTSLWVT